MIKNWRKIELYVKRIRIQRNHVNSEISPPSARTQSLILINKR